MLTPSSDPAPRSWLFAPGHNRRILEKSFEAGADEVLLDLEDGVGPELKDIARSQVVSVLRTRPAWVRINKPHSREAELDLEAMAGLATGIRVPKVDSAGDVAWVRERLGGRPLPITASIESALGVLNSLAIASSPGVISLAFGNVDFGADLGIDPSDVVATAHARSQLVLASRAAGIQGPSDGVFTLFTDDCGLRAACVEARRLGFVGKSAIHPRQVAVINQAFSPTIAELEWARAVVTAYQASGGAATRVGTGEMVDVPVYERALRLLRSAAHSGEQPGS